MVGTKEALSNGRVPNKVAVVTGAGRGIGRATAIEFAMEGAKGVAIVDIDLHRAKLTMRAVRERIKNVDILVVKADITSQIDRENIFNQTVKTLGPIDIFVNNAAIVNDGINLTPSQEEWEQVLHTNLSATYHLSRMAAGHMTDAIKRGDIPNGAIINLSSI